MKILITESQHVKVALRWLNENFSPDKLERLSIPPYYDNIFYKKNGKYVIIIDEKRKYVWFDDDIVYTFLMRFFDMTFYDAQTVLRIWLEGTWDLEGYKPTIHPLKMIEMLGLK